MEEEVPIEEQEITPLDKVIMQLASSEAVSGANILQLAKWFKCVLNMDNNEVLVTMAALLGQIDPPIPEAPLYLDVLRQNIGKVDCDQVPFLVDVLAHTKDTREALALAAEIESTLDIPRRHIIIPVGRKEYLLDPRGVIWVSVQGKNNSVIEPVLYAYPEKIRVLIDPLGGTTHFEITWLSKRGRIITNGIFDEVLGLLRAEGVVARSSQAADILAHIINYFVSEGLADIAVELDRPGFYIYNGEIVAVKVPWAQEVREKARASLDGFGIPLQELREALELLDELVTKWYGHAQERFVTVIKWALMAPFGRVYKDLGEGFIPWLYLWGASKTGKTTMGRIIRAIWNLGPEWEVTGSNIDTPARLGHICSRGTFPVIVNETENALYKDEIQAMVKNAVESKVVRGKYLAGRGYVNIPSLTTMMMTTNKPFPPNDALRRRFIVLNFSFSERISEEREEEFRAKVEPRLSILHTIGKAFYGYVVTTPLQGRDWVDYVTAFLARAYRLALGKVPDWVLLFAKQRLEDFYEEEKDYIRAVLVEALQGGYSRFVRQEVYSLRERVQLAITNETVPWIRFIDGGQMVWILSSVTRLLQREGIDITLKSLAELFGWDYKNIRLNGRVVKAIVVPLEKFVDELVPTQNGGEKGGNAGENEE